MTDAGSPNAQVGLSLYAFDFLLGSKLKSQLAAFLGKRASSSIPKIASSSTSGEFQTIL